MANQREKFEISKMNQHYKCPTHGHTLTKALDNDGNVVLLPQALKVRDKDYFCPNPECRAKVTPEGGTIVRAGDYYRKGHFNIVPESKAKYSGPKRESLGELVRDAVAETLRYSRDFNKVYTNVEFKSERHKKDKGWWKHKNFNVDVVARREGHESLDVILHVVELPLKSSANDLYQKIKEIADEQIPSIKMKYLSSPDLGKVPLKRRVYQNFIVLKNERSYRPTGKNKVELVPTIYNFIGGLTETISYFDPVSMNSFLVSISDSQKVDSEIEHDPRRLFKVKIEELPYFSFMGQDIGKLQKPLKNFPERNSINIAKWKLAVPTPIKVNENGRPVSIFRSDGQSDLLF